MRRDTAGAALGAVVALAWATSLRAWMTHLAIEFDDWPQLTWEGTFLGVLLPAVVVGALIGLDWQRRRHGRTALPGVTWSPLLLALTPALLTDDFIATLLDTGEGSGAIGVVLVGMAGGLAISGRGPAWVRSLAGVLLAVGITGVMVVIFYVHDQAVTASGVFGGVHLTILMAWLAAGCSLPMRHPPAAQRNHNS